MSLDLTDDIIDVRDIIERFEELESEKEDFETAVEETNEAFDDVEDTLESEDPNHPDREAGREKIAQAKGKQSAWIEENGEEFAELKNILEDLKDNGGDEQWRGDWYPVTLIRDSYFTTYAIELLEDCGDIPRNLPHYVAIDWDATARNIQVDYTSTEINGAAYWFR